MSPSLYQWESDPLFSAAEVVQDSADRMESIFRLLLHELSLLQGDNSDPKLLASIDCHRRDLATILETTKWQLEDFQRAVSLSVTAEKSQTSEDMISRHRKFIRAIREQVIRVEKSLEDRSLGNPVRNNEWVNLNEEDRYGLALFLSGELPSKQSDPKDSGDNDMLKRFLESTAETCPSIENQSRELEGLSRDCKFDSRNEMNLRRVGSYTSGKLGIQAMGLLPETSRNGFGGDLEANEAEQSRSFIEESKSRRFQRFKVFGFFGNLWAACGGRFARSYTKRLKDGDEQSDSPSATNVSNDFQNLLGTCRNIYQRSHYVQLISLLIFMLLILGEKSFYAISDILLSLSTISSLYSGYKLHWYSMLHKVHSFKLCPAWPRCSCLDLGRYRA